MVEDTKADEPMPLTSSDAKESYVSFLEDAGSTDESPPTLPQTGSDKSKRRRGVKMDAGSTLQVEHHIQRSILMHTLAAEYFNFRHFWLFEFQQGLLTMFSSIVAFVATTELNIEDRTKVILTTIVGVTTIAVGFLQAMNSLCSYGTRAVMHQSVALDLRDRKSNLRILRIKLGYIGQQMSRSRDVNNFAGEEMDEDEYSDGTFESIRDKFEQSLIGCKSPIPVEIDEAFSGFEASLHGAGTIMNDKVFIDLYGPKFPFEILFFKQDDIVAKQIMDYPLFPFSLPRASQVVKNSRELLRTELKEDWKFYIDA
eukprot:CAMPEP_0197264096 /NCGR_PEP_ID=MMETSP1432-20130617/1593_1 /TAXON_ID=44447 /ORGANISM="Pseudo-nitzschia delicatissima, Strain UNC1205" /LENGTH=311 /DNA_ID=CAMNT_0042728705 /DNA_START=141 /DNA_END=1076 /DNA_ORIENTATION=+